MSLLFRGGGSPERRSISLSDMFGRGVDLDADRHTSFPQYSATEALGLSAVAACVELRANYVAQMPFDAYREGPGGQSLKVSPQPLVIVRPSAKGVPRSAWMKQAQYARLLWGNATLVVGARDGAGYPKSLDVLPPWEVQFSRTSILEQLEVRVCGQPFDRADLVIVPGQVKPGSTIGVAPLAASGLVDLGRRAQAFGRDWFTSGAVPSSIIYSDDAALTSAQADSIVSTIMSKWRGRRPAVLGSGLRYEKVSVPANESQFLETIRQNAAEIAIILGIAPEAIGVSVSAGSVTYANRESRAQQVMVDTVNADVLLWQEVMYDVLPRPQFVRFGTGALLRTDLKSRYESYATGIAAGWLDPSEARAWEDLPPMTVVAPAAATRSDEFEQEMRSMLTTRSMAGNETHIHLPDSLSVEMRQEPIIVPAPVVNIPAPVVNVTVEPTPVTVVVEPTPVTVEVAAPQVQVDVSVPEPVDKIEAIRFERDVNGNIVGAVKGTG